MTLADKADAIVRLVTKLLVMFAGILLAIFVALDLTQESDLLVIGVFGFFTAFTSIAFTWSRFWQDGDVQHQKLRSAGEGFMLGAILVLLSLLFGFAFKNGAFGGPALAFSLRVLHVGTLAVALTYGIFGCLELLSVDRRRG